MRIIFVLSLMVFSLNAWSQASGLTVAGSKFAAFKAASALFPHAFPVKKMEKGILHVKLVPAYMKFNYDEQGQSGRQYQKMEGGGGALGSTYGFSERIGLSFLALGFEIDGEGTVYDASTNIWGSNRANGGLASLNLVFDFFGKKEEQSFHLLILGGLSYAELKEAAAMTVEQSSIRTERKFSGMALSFGIKPQIGLGSWLKLSPFMIATEPFSDTTDTCTASGPNATCPSSLRNVTKGANGFGTELAIVPWNLSSQMVFPTEGITCYTLKWEFSF